MKKRTIIALIVAGILIIAGGVMVVLGLSYAGDSAAQSVLTEQEVLISDSFESVVIDTEDCDVRFMPYNGDVDAQVTLLEQDAVSHSVVVEEGVLKIEMVDERKWTDYIGIFGKSESMVMTVYLPNVQYTSIRITTDTGDVKIPGVLAAEELLVRSSTGDVWLEGGPVEMLDCMISTGDITVRGGTAKKMKLRTGTGDLDIHGSTGEELHLTSDTGEMDVENVITPIFTVNSGTGDVELEGVVAEEYLQIRTNTGEVGIENCDAGKVDIETNTGDVSGHFLTSKWFSAFSDTGNVTVPNTPEGGECRIQTNSGDIHFK